ncbi:MAG: outer membrane lipoprotein-sorting protein [Myxococcota bacterium]
MSRCVTLVVIAAAFLLPRAVPAAPLTSIEEIRACMRGNLPKQTSRQEVKLTARDRAGGERELEAQMHWKRFPRGLPRVHIRVEAPIDMRGSAYLLIEEEQGRESAMYVYLPTVQRVRRITARTMSDQLWGTDFSYDDIRQLQWISEEAAPERLPDQEVAGRNVYVLSLKHGPEENSSYERIVAFVDHDTCVSLKLEFYERGDQPRKVLRADPASLFKEGRRWIARDAEMSDLRDETSTRIHIVKVENDVEIRDRVFNPTMLDRGH